jgi:protein disulfide-isomerase-like protein
MMMVTRRTILTHTISHILFLHLVWKGISVHVVHEDFKPDYTVHEPKYFEPGESECDGQDESSCLAIPCCTFDGEQCLSKVGDEPCDSVIDRVDYEPLVEDDPNAPLNEEGVISAEETTMDEAMIRCNDIPRCLGFSFPGVCGSLNTDCSITVYYQSNSKLKRAWTTYLHKGVKSSPAPARPVPRFRGSLAMLESEPELPPEALHTGAILNLVGTTMKRVTQDPSKDVLVNFYAPWCGFCQKFKSQYGKLAEDLRHVKTLQIAQMDATQNQMEDLNIPAFPTVILFPAGDRKSEPIKYVGNRSPVDMTHWLQHHATYANFPSTPQEQEVEASSGLLDSSEESADL